MRLRPPTMMKTRDVAKRLNCSLSFVYGLLDSGRLKHYVLGPGQGGKRVSEEQLQAYLQSVERGGEQPQRLVLPPKSKPLSCLTLD